MNISRRRLTNYIKTLHQRACRTCSTIMATQWPLGPLHPKGKIRVSLLQEVLYALDVHSLGVGKYGHYTAQAQESLLDSGATNKVSPLICINQNLE